MDMLATLRRSGGVNALARQLGEPPATATAQAIALLPPLINGFSQYSNSIGDILTILDDLGGSDMAAAVMADDPVDDASGRALLDFILDGEGRAAAGLSTGLDPMMLKRMLPLLAMLIGGYIAARAGAGSLDQEQYSAILQPIKVTDPEPDDI